MTKLNYSLAEVIELELPIIKKISSGKSGHCVAIIVGVHGNEKGPQLQWDWLNNIKITNGTVYTIFANITAAKQNRRFVNVNLNRRFGLAQNDYPEDEIARRIEVVLDKCDSVLDLHMYNESMDRPFVICSKTSNSIAKLLPVEYIVNFPEDVYGGATDNYMARKNKVGICFETGSLERPKHYASIIRKGILAFLGHYNLIDYTPKYNENVKVLVMNSTKYVEHPTIKFSRKYSSFDNIKKDEVICIENGKEIIASKNGYILFPRPNNPIGSEAYYTLVES